MIEKFQNIPTRSKVILIGGLLVLGYLLVAVWLTTRGPTIFNPANDELVRDPRAGLDSALIYQFADITDQIDADDETNFGFVKEDLALYARETIPQLKDPSTLIGFTFTDTEVINSSTTKYTGFYYGVDDPILLELTTFDRGVIRLSITNTETGENIDDQLSLNGAKNELITDLPIRTDQFYIVYNREVDRISISFDLGYTEKDINEAIQILKNIYGSEYDEELFSFAVNQIGFKTLPELRKFAKSPDNEEPPVRR